MKYEEKHAANLKKVEALKDPDLRAMWLEMLEGAYCDGIAGNDVTDWLNQCEADAGDKKMRRIFAATLRTAYRAGQEAAG